MALQVIEDLFTRESPVLLPTKKDKFLSGVWLWFQVKDYGEFCGNPSLKPLPTLPGLYSRLPLSSSGLDVLDYFFTIHMIGHSGHEERGMI